MTTPITQKQSPLEILDTQFLDRKAEFKSVLPSNCTFERFTRIIKTAAIQTPELLLADRPSLFMSCFKAAQDGLLPDGKESALVIYNTKKNGVYVKAVQYMPMIAGVLKKIRNSGELASISAHVVYENDEFDYCLGDEEHIKHKPAILERINPICVYAIAKTKDGAIYREVMNVTEIEKIRALSSAEQTKKKYPNMKTPWDNHWGEMAKKTVIRRLSKLLPMSTDVEQIIQRDDEMFDFNVLSQKPVNSTIEKLNRQIVEAEIEPITEIEEKEEDLIISPEIEKQAEEMFMEIPEND